MTFSIDNYDIFNYINNVQEDEINLGALLCFKIASEFNHSNAESLVHSNNALQNLINTLLFHGESFYLLKQYDKALLYYDKVLEIDPFNLIASSFRGRVYYSLGQYYKAFFDLNKALDINPIYMAILLYRGEAYFNHGHYDKAFSDLEIVLEQYDEDLYNLGMSLEIKSNYTNALILQAKICFNLEKYSDTIQFLSKI
ncbi:tetratricopeptide repeat protein [Gigaspora margarita]|uniref:Tetratricopeptide repeat protein n=1 Tax=Gigaspora margarita TaxID=4874 RepID=A0A8H3XA05_GIGMA|nr:tetratricopeptide repeat protein [Gigaspora margarita]